MFIGIDIGTTATKAIIIDSDQNLIANASFTYEYVSRKAGYAEQQPQQWIDAVRDCLGQLRKKNGQAFAAAKQIGFSGQMHSLVALDATQVPLKPAVLWNDARGQNEADQLAKLVPNIEGLTGAAAMPSFTAAKLLWMRHNEPQLFEKIKHVILPKDFVRLWLTGELATDHSDAAGTQLYDQRNRDWSNAVFSTIGLEKSVLPAIAEACDHCGALRPEIALELGLPKACEVVIGGADTAAGALGLGCVTPGDSFISVGTGSIFATITDGYQPTTKGFLHNFANCLPTQWYRMGAMLNGASCLAWAARLVGADDIGQLLTTVEANYAGPSRVMFIPYLNGERTPHNNAELRGALLGLDSASGKLDVAQAVIEGVSFSLKDAMNALGLDSNATGIPGIIGGGARSQFWVGILATILSVPLARYAGADLWPALGAARLGMVSGSANQLASIAKKPSIESVAKPNNDFVEAYAERYQIYKKAREVSIDFARLNKKSK
jgi:xylulokinase